MASCSDLTSTNPLAGDDVKSEYGILRGGDNCRALGHDPEAQLWPLGPG